MNGVLKKNFSYTIDQCSPVQEDFSRKVQYDDEGKEFISYLPVDYPALQKSHGFVTDWSLEALLKAGINPNFPISTGLNTRLEGVDVLSQFESLADSILSSESETSND